MPREALIVVGVGASAGGLDAFAQLLRSIPSDSRVAWVLVQHLDPTHDSLMAELLAKHTILPVTEVEPDERIEAGHVYVIPPNKFLTVEEDTFRLDTPAGERGSRMAIDHLFRSLAESFGRNAIGVVLTGTGSDGTLGLRAIKAAGGYTIAQEPDTAAYDGMPRSAVEASAADVALEIAGIPSAIQQFFEHPYVQSAPDDAGEEGIEPGPPGRRSGPDETEIPDDLESILGVLRDTLGIDLSMYKASTLSRRIERRMGLRQITSLPKYRE